MNELTNVARRKMSLSWDETHELLSTLRRLVTVVPLTLDDHDQGIYLAERYQLSVYDAMIVASALAAGCERLWTEDLQDGALIETVRITNPFASPKAPESKALR